MPEPHEIPERFLNGAQNFIRKGAEMARQQTRAVRLQSQISKLRDQKRKLYMQMGQKVFDLFRRDLVKNADLRFLCTQLTSVDAEIGLREEELDQLRRGTIRRDSEAGVDAEEDLDDDVPPSPPATF